jgi:hypothetical protein
MLFACEFAHGRGGGSPVLHDWLRPKERLIFANLVQPHRVEINMVLKIPQAIHRARSNIYAGCFTNGTVLLFSTSHLQATASTPCSTSYASSAAELVQCMCHSLCVKVIYMLHLFVPG